jgi:hypothetical protein
LILPNIFRIKAAAVTDEFELLKWDEEIIEILKELPLNQLQWESFLKVVKLLDRLGSVSIHYLHNRFNIGAKVTDRILASIYQLGWGSFSGGYINISSQAKEDFAKIKKEEYSDDNS